MTHTLVPRLWALPKLALNSFLLAKYKQHEEWQADENVPNQKKLLQAAVDFFEHITDPDQTDWFSSHPHPAKRAARFQQRLDFLDQQEQQAKMQDGI